MLIYEESTVQFEQNWHAGYIYKIFIKDTTAFKQTISMGTE